MSKISIRYGKVEDKANLVTWLMDPGIANFFPMMDAYEVEDSSRIWMSYIRVNSVLTALYDGVVCATSVLYLSPYKKLAHQCLFAVIVDAKYRGKGVGFMLITELMTLAKQRFNIEILHLEVYKGNPAVSLYERLGFEHYGVHKNFLKSNGGNYLDKLLMQKQL